MHQAYILVDPGIGIEGRSFSPPLITSVHSFCALQRYTVGTARVSEATPTTIAVCDGDLAHCGLASHHSSGAPPKVLITCAVVCYSFYAAYLSRLMLSSLNYNHQVKAPKKAAATSGRHSAGAHAFYSLVNETFWCIARTVSKLSKQDASLSFCLRVLASVLQHKLRNST